MKRPPVRRREKKEAERDGPASHRGIRFRPGGSDGGALPLAHPAGGGPDLLRRHRPGALWQPFPGGHFEIRPPGCAFPALLRSEGHPHRLRDGDHHLAGGAAGGKRPAHGRRGRAHLPPGGADDPKQAGRAHRHGGLRPLRCLRGGSPAAGPGGDRVQPGLPPVRAPGGGRAHPAGETW